MPPSMSSIESRYLAASAIFAVFIHGCQVDLVNPGLHQLLHQYTKVHASSPKHARRENGLFRRDYVFRRTLANASARTSNPPVAGSNPAGRAPELPSKYGK